MRGKGERDAVEFERTLAVSGAEVRTLLASPTSPEQGSAASPTAMRDGAEPPHVLPQGDRSAVEGDTGAAPTQIDRFLIVNELGRGAMGVVYAAYDPQLDRKVAIKLIVDERASAAGQSRLVREAKAMAKLSHQHVVHVHDVGRVGGGVYLAMEYVAGRTLREWLQAARSPEEIVGVFRQAGEGLAAAHAAGIVHRDFKPENVLIDEQGCVKIADFGLAGDAAAPAGPLGEGPQERTAAGTMLGTPAYMSPEQWLCAPADARSDQYAFCVALHEALYGRRPFAGATIAELRARVLTGEPAEPVGAGGARWIWPLVARGIRRDPQARWPEMRPLIEALGRDPSRRRRRRVALGAAAALVAACAGGALQWRRTSLAERLEACSGSAAVTAAMWDDARRDAVRQALVDTGVPRADAAAVRVVRFVDDYVVRWNAVLRASCEATVERAELTPDVMALRERCLVAQQQELAAALDLVTAADETVVQHLTELTESLPRPERCGGLRYVIEYARDPAEASLGGRIQQVELELVRATAETNAGLFQRAHARAEPLLAEAKAIGNRRLLARVHGLHGRISGDLGDAGAAAEHYLAGFSHALASDSATSAVELAVMAMYNEGYYRADLEAGRRWSLIAEGLLDRTEDEDLRVNHRAYLATLRSQGGDHAGALAAIDEAIALGERVANTPEDSAALLVNRGVILTLLGRWEEAARELRAIQPLVDEMRGPLHPDTAKLRDSLGVALLYSGDVPGARAEFARAAELQEQVFGTSHPLLAQTLINLAAADVEAGEGHRARASAERAMAMLEPLGADVDVLRHYAHLSLGDALLLLGEFGAAEPHCAAALTSIEALQGATHPHVGPTLVCLAELRLQRGDAAGARPLLERALQIYAGREDVPHADRGRAHFAAARACAALGEIEAARRAVDEATARWTAAGPHYARRRDEAVAWREALPGG